MHRVLAIALSAVLLAACTVSPLGRQQLAIMPDAQLAEMGQAAFRQIEAQTPRTQDTAARRYVQCVSDAILQVVDNERQWQVVVLEDASANAFALPGGQIGVHTGLLDIAENQHQLAAVIGHEIAHVVARHANERVSQQFAAEQALGLADAMLAGTVEPGTQRTLMALLGVGAQVGVLLPYSRVQEIEADELGLDYMARAGFDPRESVRLWHNMAQAATAKPPEFLSTHPGDERRIERLQARMDRAMQLYEEAQAAGRRPQCG
jgi:predicted Zn-dependent protease